MVVQDALIKNYKERLYDHGARRSFDFAEDARSATFRLREGIKFHDGSPVTPDDVKWSYEHYHGARAQLHDETDRVKILDSRTVQFEFKRPFLTSPPDRHRQQLRRGVGRGFITKVGRDGFAAKGLVLGP
jgi:peptide/nickel transport system substrate-binding protein